MCHDCRGVAARVLAVALQRELAERDIRQPHAEPGAMRDVNFAASSMVVALLDSATPAIYDDQAWPKLIAERVAKLDDQTLTLARKVVFWEAAVLSDIVVAVRMEMAKRAPSGSVEIAYGLHEADLDDRDFTQSTMTALSNSGAPSYPQAKNGIPVS
jgi:hypothetical protein